MMIFLNVFNTFSLSELVLDKCNYAVKLTNFTGQGKMSASCAVTSDSVFSVTTMVFLWNQKIFMFHSEGIFIFLNAAAFFKLG